MNTYEKCKRIRRGILCDAAEVMVYTNWPAAFAAQQIRQVPDRILEAHGPVNIAELTLDQMTELGFGIWSDENPMRLIPLWLYPFLPDELEVTSISGTKSVLKKLDMDTDIRGGCLAFGIVPAA